jgi:SAM-dependent methyltransferase
LQLYEYSGARVVKDTVSPPQRQEQPSYSLYGRYYDTVYSWRDYEDECQTLDARLRNSSNPPRTLLDLGCGTGTHAVLLAGLGYSVLGLDSSKTMIEQAREKARREDVDVQFLVADVRRFRLHKTFDAAFSLFSGFSYLTSDKDLADTLRHVRSHLVRSGLLVFDAWCSKGSETGIKLGYRVSDESGRRAVVFSETETNSATRHVALRLFCLILDKDRVSTQFRETHALRLFAPDEVKRHLEENGFRPVEIQLRNHDRNMDVVAEAI